MSSRLSAALTSVEMKNKLLENNAINNIFSQKNAPLYTFINL